LSTILLFFSILLCFLCDLCASAVKNSYYQGMKDLTGKPIAITGASAGIGRATAIACAQAGMPVAVSARREDKLIELVEEIKKLGGRAIAVPGNVDNQADCDRLIERCIAEFGSIYSVYANAGYGYECTIANLTDRDVREMFDTNFFGTLNTIRAALPHLQKANQGHILICSSCLAKSAMPYHGCYSATKVAQDHIARCLRIELRKTGIRTSCIFPIGTATEFFGAKAARAGHTPSPRPPGAFTQPPERVANAIVACLRRPKPEVWTSHLARIAFCCANLSPRFTDAMLARYNTARHH